LPLHPEYRTMPMVWYVPPLSPVVDAISRESHDGENVDNLFGAISALRIPVQYLAGLFTAGDTEPVDRVLRTLAAMRSYMRDHNLGRDADPSIPASVGMSEESMYEMYRLLAIAKYEQRYVIPTAYAAQGHKLEESVTDCALDFDGGPGMYESGPFGEASGAPVPVAVETFQALRERQTTEELGVRGGHGSRVNLLNWDGKGTPDSMFTPRPGSPRSNGGGA
jgi:nitrate reductase beta subunit